MSSTFVVVDAAQTSMMGDAAPAASTRSVKQWAAGELFRKRHAAMTAFLIRRIGFGVRDLVRGARRSSSSIVRIVPGDPAQAHSRRSGDAARRSRRCMCALGLDKPIRVQYVEFLSRRAARRFGRVHGQRAPRYRPKC